MKRFELLFLFIHVPVDAAMLFLAALSAYHLRFTEWAVALKDVSFGFGLPEYLGMVLWVIPLWLLIFALLGLYQPRARRFANDILNIFLGASAGLAGIALYVMFTQQLFDSRFLLAASWGFALLYVTLGRLVLRGIKGMLYRSGYGRRRTIIVGDDDIATELQESLQSRKELGYRILASFPHFNTSVRKEMDALSIDEVIMTNPRAREEETLQLLDYLQGRHITFKYSADLFATLAANTSMHPLAGIPIVEMKPTRLEGWGRILKRIFDIVMSIIIIILSSPLLLISSIIILIETGRPVLYKNERVGVRQKRFLAYKLRSMYQKDSTGDQFGGEAALKKEEELIKKKSKKGPIYKVANDPRVTPFGRFIRRFSIDEFPQFVNVLKGEMSIVGPRPHQPREVEGYQKHHRLAFNVKPGITGLAQISGRSDLSYEEEMRLDVLYIERWSMFLDIIIFVKTPFILFKSRKAE